MKRFLVWLLVPMLSMYFVTLDDFKELEQRVYELEQGTVLPDEQDDNVYEYYDSVDYPDTPMFEMTVEYKKHYDGVVFTGEYEIISVTVCSEDKCETEYAQGVELYSMDEIISEVDDYLEQLVYLFRAYN